jgi:hypothetical protein
MAKIASKQSELHAMGDFFFLGWDLRRRYTEKEIRCAKAFRLIIRHTFEPPGELCGTLYDESNACQYCGSGGRHVNDLILEIQSLPKQGNLGIAKTIAGEIVVSQRFVEVFQANKLRGADFRPVKQSKKPAAAVPGWYELMVVSTPLTIVAPTRAGITPFDDGSERLPNQANILDQLNTKGSWCDREGQYRCPIGHTIGLNLLSELSVDESGFHGSDIAFTTEKVGVRRGLLRPESLLLVSPRLRECLIQQGLKGITFEVVHLVPSHRPQADFLASASA